MRWINPPLWSCPKHGEVLDESAAKIDGKTYCLHCLDEVQRAEKEAKILKVCQELTCIREVSR